MSLFSVEEWIIKSVHLLSALVSSLNRRHSLLEAATAQQIARLTSELTSVQTELTEVKETMSAVKEQLDRANKAIDSLIARVTKHEKQRVEENSDLKDAIAKLQAAQSAAPVANPDMDEALAGFSALADKADAFDRDNPPADPVAPVSTAPVSTPDTASAPTATPPSTDSPAPLPAPGETTTNTFTDAANPNTAPNGGTSTIATPDPDAPFKGVDALPAGNMTDPVPAGDSGTNAPVSNPQTIGAVVSTPGFPLVDDTTGGALPVGTPVPGQNAPEGDITTGTDQVSTVAPVAAND